MPWNGIVGQHMQGRVCLQSWPLLGPFGRLLADFLRYSYYNRTITVLSYENRTFPYYNRTTTLRTNPVRPHATGPYQPRTTKARFLRNCHLCLISLIRSSRGRLRSARFSASVLSLRNSASASSSCDCCRRPFWDVLAWVRAV